MPVERISVFDREMPNIGLYTRTTTQGEEHALVMEFIEYYCDRFLSRNKVDKLAVFVEPRVSSGFPDIVFAWYAPAVMDNWSIDRTRLGTPDLKILSHLILMRGSNGAGVITALRMPERQVITSLEKLIDADLVSRVGHTWVPRELRDIYGIRRLVSVEAKVNNMRRVAEQSFINTWFSSQSYALTNTCNPQNETVQSLAKHGIGLYCKSGTFKKVIEARRLSLPSSYLSLQFNEWIGNASLQ